MKKICCACGKIVDKENIIELSKYDFEIMKMDKFDISFVRTYLKICKKMGIKKLLIAGDFFDFYSMSNYDKYDPAESLKHELSEASTADYSIQVYICQECYKQDKWYTNIPERDPMKLEGEEKMW